MEKFECKRLWKFAILKFIIADSELEMNSHEKF